MGGPAPTTGRFVGQSVRRTEDPRLLTGRGTYVDDVVLPGMLHAAFVRSDVARGRLTRVDVDAARAAPGVHAVLTAADLDPHVAGPMLASHAILFGAAASCPPERTLAAGDVRFVGDPIALVVAESRYLAEDAADLVEVDYDVQPAVVDYETAADDPNLVHPEKGTNVAARSELPVDDELRAVLDTAPHVVTATFRQHRQTNAPMETRGLVAHHEPFDGRLDVWMSTQNPHEARAVFSRITGVPEHRVRVRIGDVGGGFGQKAFVPRDEMIVVLAAHRLGVPVKWVEDRRENLVASNHARTDRVTVTMAFDADGHILGAHLDHLEDAGAHPVGGTGGGGPFVVMMFPGPYRVPRLAWSQTSVWTNTCGRGAYRGPWQMESVAREQMMDLAARAVGIDPLELRRRNVLHRDELPYTAASGVPLADISPSETLEQAAALVDYDGFRRAQAAARAEGRLVGLGIGLYVEPQTGMGPWGTEPANIRVDPDGKVDVHVASGSHGQGIETTTAQLVAEHLGVHVDDVRVHQGDTASAPFGAGTGGSRSGPFLGAAARQAALELRTKVLRIAGHLLEAAPEDLDMVDGVASVRGTPVRSVALPAVARVAYQAPEGLPPGVEPGLEVATRYRTPAISFSNACHVATCDVDPVTGIVRLTRYVVSEDCGVMINPAIVEGQIAGGVVQGIGGVLYEHAVYDGDGNPLATTFLDYLLPTAAEVPTVEYGHVETPANTPGGHKGVGEGGAIGAPPTVFNAVADALAQAGAVLHDQPCTPDRVVAALEAAGFDT